MIRTGDGHDDVKDWAGAYVLGALEPDERRSFQRHAEQCERCQADIDDFATIPGLLSRIDPDVDADRTDRNDVDASLARVSVLTADQAGDDLKSLRTEQRRWKGAALVASAAATLLLFTAVAIGLSSGTSSTDEVATELRVTDTVAVGTVSIGVRPWGTAIAVDLVDLPARDQYRLWAVDTAGNREPAATWGPTPTGAAVVSGATALSPDEVLRIEITSSDTNDLLLAALK